MSKSKICCLIIATFFSGFSLSAQFQQQDAYGYCWKHSDSIGGPTFQWIDIRSIGTEVIGLNDDNMIGPVPMDIAFPFYWYIRDKVWIGANGFLAFSPVETIADQDTLGFPPLPRSDRKDDLIAPFMTDFNFSGPQNPGKVFYYTDTLLKQFIVAFHEVPLYANNSQTYSGANTFEVIFNSIDSSITYQYLMQSGSLFPDYLTRKYPVVIGIEDVTGTNGLMVTDTLPKAMTAIRFTPPVSPLIDVFDIKANWIFNRANGGFFVPKPATPSPVPGTSFPVRISNLGNKNINSPIDILFQLRHLDITTPFVYNDQKTATLPFMKGTNEQFDFTTPFDIPFPGTYAISLSTENQDDINSNNDSVVVEMVVVDTVSGEASFTYVIGDTSIVDGQEGRVDSTNDSGVGIYYRPYGYPSYISAVDFFFSPIPDTFFAITVGNAYRLDIYEEGSQPGKPGKLLYSDNLQATTLSFGQWTRVLVRPKVKIESDGFYVAWIPLSDSVGLVSESKALYSPPSRRTYEVVNGVWNPHRSNETKDFWVRTLMDVSEVPGPNVSVDPEFPGLTSFSISPNPTRDGIQIEVMMDQVSNLGYTLFDPQGRLLLSQNVNHVTYWNPYVKLDHLPKGTYVIRIASDQGHMSKRLILR